MRSSHDTATLSHTKIKTSRETSKKRSLARGGFDPPTSGLCYGYVSWFEISHENCSVGTYSPARYHCAILLFCAMENSERMFVMKPPGLQG